MTVKNRFYGTLLGCSMLMTLLEAKSCPVDLQYQQIHDDVWTTEAEAIQHQYVWQEYLYYAAAKDFEVVKDFTIPLKVQFPENKKDPRSKVYGYHKDGKLDLDGGHKKSYNDNFKNFKLRYHGSMELRFPTGDPQEPVYSQPLTFLYPDVVENIFRHNIPYFVQRGFDIQGADTFKKFGDQYIWTYSAGQSQENGLDGYMALRLVWDDSDDKDIPSHVDLHASAQYFEYFVLDTYKNKKGEYENGHGYPTRIPVTTDFCRFQKYYETKPMAFYDKKQHVLTIHVPATDECSHFLTRRQVNTGNPELNVDYVEHLAGFYGSFKVFGRDKYDRLVPSCIKDAELFAQVSDEVTIRSRVVQHPDDGGEPEFFTMEWPINLPIFTATSQSYTGVVAAVMNGGSTAYDCYAEPIPDLNAYEAPLDPADLPAQEVNHHRYHHGDNPRTRCHERYSDLSSITLWDNEAWALPALRLPLDMLSGKTFFPENVANAVIPTAVSAPDTMILVNSHEFTHQAQNASGTINFLPVEAMAVGVELDPHAGGNIFMPLRSGAFTQRLIRTMRGEFTAMRPDAFGLSTYGMGVWWKYLQDAFDHNNQVMRRTMDILSSKTLGPLLDKNGFPDSSAALPVNASGGSAAINCALKELFKKNIKDVWNDYSISITLLRNNLSIPEEWRHHFPYWVYNSEYSGFGEIYGAAAVFGAGRFANFWEKMNNNDVIPANFNTPYTGETFIRTLPEHFETSALSLRTYAFNVPRMCQGGPESITVNVPQGEWRVTLVQFTSDGTPVGSFIADGPHTLIAGGDNTITFDIAGHSPAFSDSGNIRLVCVNVTFDSTGKQLEDYFTPEAPSGYIVIDAS